MVLRTLHTAIVVLRARYFKMASVSTHNHVVQNQIIVHGFQDMVQINQTAHGSAIHDITRQEIPASLSHVKMVQLTTQVVISVLAASIW